MTSISDARAGSLVYTYGARPELFTVSSGAYHSSISFGSGATPQVTYNGVTYPYGATATYTGGGGAIINMATNSTFTRNDDVVYFNVTIDINGNLSVPTALPGCIATGSELRIRNLVPTTNVVGGTGLLTTNNGTMSRSWAPPRLNSMPPTFRDVQIYYANNTSNSVFWNPLSANYATFSIGTGNSYEFGARLLSDDTFALYLNVFDDYGTYSAKEFPITYELFNSMIAFGSGDDYNRITITGTYFAS